MNARVPCAKTTSVVSVTCAAIVVGLLALAETVPARASSDAAWAAFRADVAKTCLAAAKSSLFAPLAIVDGHGTPSYGVAILYGRESGTNATSTAPALTSIVCVYDKKTKKAELSGFIETNFVAH